MFLQPGKGPDADHISSYAKELKRRSRRYLRSPVLSLFSTNKNRKFVKTTIYICRVVYTAQTKARQALDRSRKFVKTTIYIYRVVYTAQTKAIQALDRSRKFVKTTIYLNRVVYKTKTSRQKRHQQKIKNLHSIFIQKEV